MISEERLEKAITYLAHTDGTVAEREAKSVTSQQFRDHVAYAENCWVDAELLDNKRHTEEVIIDVWRTMSANLRKV